MDKETKALMKEALKQKLKSSIDIDKSAEERKEALADAISIAKQMHESNKSFWDHILKAVELSMLVIVPVVTVILDIGAKRKYIEDVQDFEKEEVYRTNAGKGLSSLFRFK